QELESSVFLPEHAFPSPLTYTYAVTKGADLNWVPIVFGERLRLAYSRTFYGTGYYIYHQFVRGAARSQAPAPWNQAQPDADLLTLLSRAGDDLTAGLRGTQERRGRATLAGTVVVATLRDGAAFVRRLTFSVPADQAVAFGRARLRITWDDRRAP